MKFVTSVIPHCAFGLSSLVIACAAMPTGGAGSATDPPPQSQQPYQPPQPPNPQDLSLAQRFSPILMFDRAGRGYPMSAQVYYELMLARDPRIFDASLGEKAPGVEQSTLDRSVPTYYQVQTGQPQVRITYWWYYGLQHACNETPFDKSGRHHGDWERITVTLREDREAIAAVTYYQHGYWYTRLSGPRDAPCTPTGLGRCDGSSGFPREGDHPIAYVGKISHGSFHNTPGGPGGCTFWEDFRNPSGPDDRFETGGNLVDLNTDQEAWMVADRASALRWGPPDDASNSRGEGGVASQPTMNGPNYDLPACRGTPLYALAEAGCYQSECLSGDDETADRCLKECEPGYTNTGLTCTKFSSLLIPLDVYNRLAGSHNYSYDYKLPQSDAGLTRRRRNQTEWSLP